MFGFSYRALIALLIVVSVSSAYAQNNTDLGYVPPVISLLLDDEQCPNITPATTVTESKVISSQADLDVLAGITKIDGSLLFESISESLDLSPLDSLVELTGSLKFFLAGNTEIDGFNCLQSLGKLEFLFNFSLTSISGFLELAEVREGLTIKANDQLTTISGFDVLESADIVGNIAVSDNESYDCTNPAPNFAPVTESEDNLVNCELITKTVFLSQLTTNGAIDGIDGADQLCQDEADVAGLSGTYLAWLSSGDTATAPVNRFKQSTGPYVRPDGMPVADNWTDLTDGTIDNYICVEADSDSHCDASGAVWTNVDESGNTVFAFANDACDNWTVGDISADGRRGFWGVLNEGWSNANDADCGERARLYCFEQ